jgi:DMSO/TMAO reductase YedYZ heme-binding membrane subunit
MAQWVFGGLAYGFVLLMALTSTDQAQRWMGMKTWKRLHFVGSQWIWTLFLLTYLKYVKQGPMWFYLPFLVFTLALIPIRYAKHTPPKAPIGASM